MHFSYPRTEKGMDESRPCLRTSAPELYLDYVVIPKQFPVVHQPVFPGQVCLINYIQRGTETQGRCWDRTPPRTLFPWWRAGPRAEVHCRLVQFRDMHQWV